MNTAHSRPGKVRKILRNSIFEGFFASIMVGFTQEYFIPFLVSVHATTRQIGALTAFPNLIAALLQVKSADVTARLGSRKKVLNIFVLIQALALIPMALIAFSGQSWISLFIIFVILYTSAGAFANPAWGSLISELVPSDKRGTYFAWRTMVLGFVMIGAMLLAGYIIHLTERNRVSTGFALIFCLAFLFRMVSWSYLRAMEEPAMRPLKKDEMSFWEFLSRMRKDNFVRFVVAIAAMNFSVNLAGPFFAVFMLRDLGFSYILYTVIVISASLSLFIVITRWGKHADRVGNIRVVKLTSYMTVVTPLLWIVNHNPYYLIAAQIYAGFLWAGFNLAAGNFVYDAVPSQHRTRGIAYFNVINGSALFAGALIGGFIEPHLPALFGYRILSLFLISALLRFCASHFLIKKIQEVRSVQKVRSSELFFSLIGVRPLLGVERKTLRY